MNQITGHAVEFWRMKTVVAKTGLSKTEIYRQVEAGRFPPPRKYPGSIMNFWLSTDVIAWQRSVVGADEFDALLSA
jgi:predicted DNA-binding transcriptional regulator AlpA